MNTKPPAKPSKQPPPPKQNGTVLSQQWSGPLPPPGALESFDRLIPNGAERIMAMVEQEQAHRLAQEQKALKAEVADFRRGHWIGGGIAAAAIAGAVYTAYIGASPWVSVALVGLPIAAIVQVILRRK